MRFENFDLGSPYGSIELRGLGHDWDLHNWADFGGLTFLVESNELVLEWRVNHMDKNPWGDTGNTAAGCRLRFRGLHSVRLSPRDPAYPATEGTCVASISKVIPGELQFPYKQKWEPGEEFHLRLTFQDEREIEIGAETAVLEPIE